VKKIYAVLAVLGFVLPMAQLARFLAVHGLDLAAFAALPFANAASSMFALDLIVSCLVFWTFVFTQRVPHRWLYVALTLLAGLSLALPLFLIALASRTPEQEKATRA
jgi:hypothetical protein